MNSVRKRRRVLWAEAQKSVKSVIRHYGVNSGPLMRVLVIMEVTDMSLDYND